MINAFLLLIFSPLALASDICTPISQIEPQVNYCDQNPAFVGPAQACRDRYKVLVKKKKEEVTANLAKIVKSSNTDAQSGDFKTNQSLLTSTEATLSNLIDQGFEIFDEITDYQDDLVLPIYSAYPEDFKIDPHSAQGKAVFGSKECYSEPIEDLNNAKLEIKNLVVELQKTRAKAQELHALSRGKETNLSGTAGAAASGKGDGGPVRAAKSGKSSNPPSTITGVDDAKKKDSSAPATMQPSP
jgi:hypothetical protein